MQQFLRSAGLVAMVWSVWFLVLVGSGAALGVETINLTFLRMLQNFANMAMVADILHFFLVMAVFLLLLATMIYWISRGLELWRGMQGWSAVLVASVFPLLALHLLNSLFYPVSAMAFTVPRGLAEVLILLSAGAGLALIVLAAIRSRAILLQVASVSLAVVFVYTAFGSTNAGAPAVSVAEAAEKSDQPNVIIIGVDALRPSELAPFGGERGVMPFLDSLLEQARIYAPAYTPVARTQAAWISMLTGEYPLNSGARFNLTPDHLVDRGRLLTQALGEKGYHSVWGLDERRFNDIDEEYGFDRVVGPKVGAADFLITKFSDFPIINVFANTSVAERFMPYIYLNRGNYQTYVPYRFNSEIVRAMDVSGPNFLAVHLCLPHYPFVSNLMKRMDFEIDGAPGSYNNYLSMLQLADRQLKDMLGKLERQGYLDNAIVYLVSDHGEGFPGLDKPMKNGNPYAEFDGSSFGHGTSVLTLEQYRVLMAKVRFIDGRPETSGNKLHRLSSLVDIAADISSMLDLGMETDGIPLHQAPSERFVYIESSFSPSAVSSERLNELHVLQQSVDAYEVNKNGRLRLQEGLYDALSAGKQRAAIGDDGVMVALYPDEKGSAFVVDIGGDTWWPSATMIPGGIGDWEGALEALCRFYKDDDTFQHQKMCRDYANPQG